MVGHVKTEELNVHSLESGAVVVLQEQDTYQIVTIQHIDPAGQWVVMGNDFDGYAIPVDAKLCKLVIITPDRVYPLKMNQWINSIRNNEVNSSKEVSFDAISPKYKVGKYVHACIECTAHFMGGRSQTMCKKCNDASYTAKIIINKKVKPKRPRVKSTEDIKTLALTSFQMGMKTADLSPYKEEALKTFNAWLDKQF